MELIATPPPRPVSPAVSTRDFEQVIAVFVWQGCGDVRNSADRLGEIKAVETNDEFTSFSGKNGSIPMALRKKGKWWYGDSQADIRDEIIRYSKKAEFLAHHFADAVCTCGGYVFELALDDNVGAALRMCIACGHEHLIGDSEDYIAEAELEQRTCVCESEAFEITVGVSLYQDSEDVKWLYVGCRCPKCGLTGVYGNWKNEFIGYRELLARV